MTTVKFFRYVKNMYGNVNTHEMKMPTHYVDMTKDEMEYDGGWFQFAAVAVSVICFAASAVATYYGNEELAVSFAVASCVAGYASGIAVLSAYTTETSSCRLAGAIYGTFLGPAANATSLGIRHKYCYK